MDQSKKIEIGKVIKEDMSTELKKKAISIILIGVCKYYKKNIELAKYIQKELNKIDEPNFHVIVGPSITGAVTSELKRFLLFWISGIHILIFKSG